MVLVVTTPNQILENVVFKEKKPQKNKSLANQQEEEKVQLSFEVAIKKHATKKISNKTT